MGAVNLLDDVNFEFETPETVTTTFDKMGQFLDSMSLISYQAYILILMLVFIGFVIGIYIVTPIRMYTYYTKYRQVIDRLIRIRV